MNKNILYITYPNINTSPDLESCIDIKSKTGLETICCILSFVFMVVIIILILAWLIYYIFTTI